VSITLRQAEDEAWNIVRGQQATVARVLELEKVLNPGRRFGLARKILQRARNDLTSDKDWQLRLRVGHRLALNTYKDLDLPTDKKLQDALEILQNIEDLQTTKDQETLGLAGAIYKRRWELTAQQRDLETSLAYYDRGYQEGVETDQGYTAINAAFVLDLLADIESVVAGPAPAAAAEQRQSLAADIRRVIVAEVPPLAERPDMEWLEKAMVVLRHGGRGLLRPGRLSQRPILARQGGSATRRSRLGEGIHGPPAGGIAPHQAEP